MDTGSPKPLLAEPAESPRQTDSVVTTEGVETVEMHQASQWDRGRYAHLAVRDPGRFVLCQYRRRFGREDRRGSLTLQRGKVTGARSLGKAKRVGMSTNGTN
ncbi:hypothetical protein K2X85_20445 [bacterium]|nr:hypothetical protein [bacterium]